jgi:hypothetical protein
MRQRGKVVTILRLPRIIRPIGCFRLDFLGEESVHGVGHGGIARLQGLSPSRRAGGACGGDRRTGLLTNRRFP